MEKIWHYILTIVNCIYVVETPVEMQCFSPNFRHCACLESLLTKTHGCNTANSNAQRYISNN